MATCLQVPMVVPSTLRSSSTINSSSFDMNPKKIGWRNVVSKRRLNYRCSSFNIPLPPVDPNDPFIKKLDAHLQANPDFKPSQFLDFFQNPTRSSGGGGGGGRRDTHVAHVVGGGRTHVLVSSGSRRDSHDAPKPERRLYGFGRAKTTKPPPDLASALFEARIVYLGLPMVDLVTELIIAEFMYLKWVDDKSPIQLYLNCTGTTRDDNQVIAQESNGFAIYDAMTAGHNIIETVCVGACTGYATLLLAAGTFGRRAMLPHCRIAMKVPPVPPTGLMPASKVASEAKQAQMYKDQFFKLFAYHTGHRLDEIKEKLKYSWYMGAKEALEFGVIDKIFWQGQEDTVAGDLDLTPEQWDKLSQGKTLYEP